MIESRITGICGGDNPTSHLRISCTFAYIVSHGACSYVCCHTTMLVESCGRLVVCYILHCCARCFEPRHALKTRTCSFLNLASTTSSLTAVSSPAARSPHVVEAVRRELPAPIAALAVLPNTPGTKASQNLFARVHDTSARAASRLAAGGAPREAFMIGCIKTGQ